MECGLVESPPDPAFAALVLARHGMAAEARARRARLRAHRGRYRCCGFRPLRLLVDEPRADPGESQVQAGALQGSNGREAVRELPHAPDDSDAGTRTHAVFPTANRCCSRAATAGCDRLALEQ